MLYAVFDTNWVMNSRSFDHLLGSVEDLKAISEYATIVLPEMVIEEVLEWISAMLFTKRLGHCVTAPYVS